MAKDSKKPTENQQPEEKPKPAGRDGGIWQRNPDGTITKVTK